MTEAPKPRARRVSKYHPPSVGRSKRCDRRDASRAWSVPGGNTGLEVVIFGEARLIFRIKAMNLERWARMIAPAATKARPASLRSSCRSQLCDKSIADTTSCGSSHSTSRRMRSVSAMRRLAASIGPPPRVASISRQHRQSASLSRTTGLERIVLALAADAEEYWTAQQIADFVGRSRP